MKNSSYTIITGKTLITPQVEEELGTLAFNTDGVIEYCGPFSGIAGFIGETRDFTTLTIIPGLIDIHLHGGFGVTFGKGNLKTELEKYSRNATSRGVTSFVITITGPDADTIHKLISDYAQILEQIRQWPGACPVGLHLEGPFLNPERHGAYNPAWIRSPLFEELKHYLEAGRHWIKHITIAPELPGSEEAATMLNKAGVVVSLGHSNADYKNASDALSGHYSHVTHAFNAQSPLHHRKPGVVGAVLASDHATAELIADGHHVHPAAMKILHRCLGTERIVLITDAMPGAGLPDGDYELVGQKVKVTNGKATLPDRTLAGSTATLDRCVRTMVQQVGVPLKDAVRMASLNPARVIREAHRIGSLEVGKRADFAVMDEELNIIATFVKGISVYQKESYRNT